MDEKELKETHEIINDVWQFIKCFAHVVDTDAYWDSMIATADEIWFKHNKSELCRNLTLVCMQHLEKKVHGEKGKQEP